MEVKVSRLQYFCLITNLLYGKAIGLTTGAMVRVIGSDVWTSMTIVFIAGTVLILIVAYTGSKFPDMTIVDYSNQLLGKWITGFFSILLTVFFAFAFVTSANTMTLHVKQYLLPETPFFVLCLLYTALALYGVLLGIEVIIRISFAAFVMIVLFNIITVIGTLQDFRVMNILPIMDKGIARNITTSMLSSGDLGLLYWAWV